MNIVVVGAGVVGCSVAYELASRGMSVRVIDPRGAAEGATRASAGTLAPYIEGHSLPLRMLGVRSLALYDAFVCRVTTDARTSVEYARSGTLQVATTDLEGERLEDDARDLDNAGVVHELLDSRQARQIERGLADVTRALLIPQHGWVAAQALTRALKQAAANLGAIWSTARVTNLKPSNTGVEVSTSADAIDADAVVVAAGSWSGDLRTPPPSTIHHPVKPIRGQLVHLRLDAPPVERVIWGTRCYMVGWPDGSLLVGATVEDVGFDESSTPDGVRSLMLAAAELVPAVRGARIQEVRVGLRPHTTDGLPAIGRSSTMPNVFYATGHYRTGVLLAPLTASLIADLVIDGREQPELALVRPDRLGL